MMKVLHFIWGLPQHLLGLAVIACVGAKYERAYLKSFVFVTKKRFGASLGSLIILWEGYREATLKHEYGHTKQSFIFGPLYLLLVGLPSITWNLLARVNRKISEGYYTRYPENWADRLGGVKR